MLKKAVEQETPGPGTSPVEPEGELIEIVGELSVSDGSLVGSQEPPFDERGYPVRPGQRYVCWVWRGGLFDHEMIIPEGGQAGVAPPSVGEDGGAGLHRI